MKQLGGCLITIIFLAAVVGVCGSLSALVQPRVSSEAKAEDVQQSHILDIAYSIYTQGASFYPDAEVEPYFSNPTVKPQLGAGDALINLIYIFLDGLLAIPVLVFLGLILLTQGLTTSRWDYIIAGVLVIPFALLSPFILWLSLTFQSGGTAAYYILMALGIITAAPLGLISGGGGTVYTPVIIIRIFVE